MEKLKFYKITTIALLVLNISIFAFFKLNKPSHRDGPPRENDFKKEVVKSLDLDSEQAEKFNASADRHKEMMYRINRTQSKLMEQYFQELSEENSTANKGDILAELSKLEQEKIEQTYLHFEEIKQTLHPDQIDKYDKFIRKAVNVLLNKNHRKPSPRR